jgi:serine/threonine protein kinase
MLQVPRMRYERLGGDKEITALLHANDTDDGGHRNIINYVAQLKCESFVYIVMELCDEMLETRVQRGELAERTARLTASEELCVGLVYLHTLAEPIAHRDLKVPKHFLTSCTRLSNALLV